MLFTYLQASLLPGTNSWKLPTFCTAPLEGHVASGNLLLAVNLQVCSSVVTVMMLKFTIMLWGRHCRLGGKLHLLTQPVHVLGHEGYQWDQQSATTVLPKPSQNLPRVSFHCWN